MAENKPDTASWLDYVSGFEFDGGNPDPFDNPATEDEDYPEDENAEPTPYMAAMESEAFTEES